MSFSYQQSWSMLAAMTFRGILLLLPILVPLELVLFYGNQPMNGLLLLAGVAIITADVAVQTFIACFITADPWTLEIDKQTIRRSWHSLIRTKEWSLPTKGIEVMRYDLELPACLLCWDAASMQAFHFIEFRQGGRRFLFPCGDITEQESRIKEIKTFLSTI